MKNFHKRKLKHIFIHGMSGEILLFGNIYFSSSVSNQIKKKVKYQHSESNPDNFLNWGGRKRVTKKINLLACFPGERELQNTCNMI